MQLVVGTFLLLPWVEFHTFSNLTVSNWIAIFVLGVVHTGIVYLLFFGSIRYLSVKVTAILVFLDPAVAILLDILWVGFRPSFMQIVGTLSIFIGVATTLLVNQNQVKVDKAT
ncbi:DMT family transporter [Polycladospora coralii]|uniref:DMT family transporter n=1 Tax=Polycladospora coralii TaxID=2771432 RepID=UPI0020BDC51D|nr:DMT family transporter [Polycladospora coralii]